MNKRCQRKGWMLCKEKKHVTSPVSHAQDDLTLRFVYYNQYVKHTKIDEQQYQGKEYLLARE